MYTEWSANKYVADSEKQIEVADAFDAVDSKIQQLKILGLSSSPDLSELSNSFRNKTEPTASVVVVDSPLLATEELVGIIPKLSEVPTHVRTEPMAIVVVVDSPLLATTELVNKTEPTASFIVVEPALLITADAEPPAAVKLINKAQKVALVVAKQCSNTVYDGGGDIMPQPCIEWSSTVAAAA